MSKFSGITNTIIAGLLSGHSTKRFYQILNKLEYADGSISVAFSRMKKRGYLQKVGTEWAVTKKGSEYYRNNLKHTYLENPFKKPVQSSHLVAFDIPEVDRPYRDWIRNQLKIFGYTMLQQSLWIGPGPLPKEFKERLKNLKVEKFVKVFSLAKK